MFKRFSFMLLLGLLVVPAVAFANQSPEIHQSYRQTVKVQESAGITGDGCLEYAHLQQMPEGEVHNAFVTIGDSWGFLFHGEFKENMIEMGFGDDFQYYMRAIPGTEASQWSQTEGFPCFLLFPLVKSIIEVDTGSPHVLVSLGGNDLINDFDEWDLAIYDRIEEDLRILTDMLIEVRPDVTIIFSGYDIVNMEKTELCLQFALDLVGSTEPEATNIALLTLNERMAAIDADYEQVYLTNVSGALQGTPGNPNIEEWSPLQYFVFYPFWQQDCIHMSFRGYDIFTMAIVNSMIAQGVITP